MKNNLKPIVERINELFITERKKYIIQNEDGTYKWLEISKEGNVRMFHDYMVENHLTKKKTYGVFSGGMLTKFISFDVDVPSHELVHTIYKILNNAGIESKFIHTSWSGSKGYHIDIYFSSPIALSYIKKLYDYVIFELKKQASETDIREIVELRPSPTQGLKLPLGVNRKNKDSLFNTCWYVDINNYMQFIPNLKYILDIEQIDASTIINVINKLPVTKCYNQSSPSILENVKQRSSHMSMNNQYNNTSINSLQLLDKNGLTRIGTRNQSLWRLAIYYKELQLSKKQCEVRLIQWMDRQDTQFYKTPLNTCYKEIKRIVHGVYSKNVPLRSGKIEVEFFKFELLNLLRFDRVELMTLFYLFIHSKRYADENGEFFMTYNQLMVAGNYSKTTAINHVKKLESQNAIEVARSPVYFDKQETPRNLPNKYKLNFDIVEKNRSNNSVIKTIKSIKDYEKIAKEVIGDFFTNLEWTRLYYNAYKVI